jgi:hypothetical protein
MVRSVPFANSYLSVGEIGMEITIKGRRIETLAWDHAFMYRFLRSIVTLVPVLVRWNEFNALGYWCRCFLIIESFGVRQKSYFNTKTRTSETAGETVQMLRCKAPHCDLIAVLQDSHESSTILTGLIKAFAFLQPPKVIRVILQLTSSCSFSAPFTEENAEMTLEPSP